MDFLTCTEISEHSITYGEGWGGADGGGGLYEQRKVLCDERGLGKYSRIVALGSFGPT